MKKSLVIGISFFLFACGNPGDDINISENTIEESETEEANFEVPENLKSDKILAIEFFDFGCDHCRELHKILKKLEIDYGTNLKVERHHFPLGKKTHRVAEGAECAREQEKYESFVELIFEDEYFKNYGDDILLEMAKKGGLDTNQFIKCLASDDAFRRVSMDRKKGEKLGVSGTPFLIINENLHIPGMIPEEKMRDVFDQILSPKTDESSNLENAEKNENAE